MGRDQRHQTRGQVRAKVQALRQHICKSLKERLNQLQLVVWQWGLTASQDSRWVSASLLSSTYLHKNHARATTPLQLGFLFFKPGSHLPPSVWDLRFVKHRPQLWHNLWVNWRTCLYFLRIYYTRDAFTVRNIAYWALNVCQATSHTLHVIPFNLSSDSDQTWESF